MAKIKNITNDEIKVKILTEILKFPVSKKFTKRQIAKLANIPKSTAHRRIQEMINLKVLKEEKKDLANIKYVSINTNSELYSDLKEKFKPEVKQMESKTVKDEKLNLEKLEKHLWQAADILRGSIDSSDYKNYIFGLLFLKRINDVFDERIEKLVKEGNDEDFVRRDKDFHDYFFVPEKSTWKYISKQNVDIGAAINKAFERLEDENEIIHHNVLSNIDFNDKERLPDALLDELIQHFSKISLKNRNLEDRDIFGRAYEFLIRKFADDAGKKGGEFYTPREVVEIIVDCLNPKPKMTIYDPCCGSGGMLIYSAYKIRENNGSMESISLYGQEKNLNTWSICQMNMLLHDLTSAHIRREDTLANPQFLENGNLKTFDRVVANPMWNQKKWHKSSLKDDQYNRFKFGLPSKSSGDWAWIQHMLASLNKSGKMGVVLDNGALFRSRSEGKIREKALEKDLIEAVIALPKNLFANTSSPGCIMMFNKDKPEERKGKVLFIYAEDQKLRESSVKIYDELSNQNKLTQDGIDKIVDTYKNLVKEGHHSRLVGLEEIEENDWNLNIPRYVDTTEPEEPVDVSEQLKDLKTLEKEREQFEEKIDEDMEELGYE